MAEPRRGCGRHLAAHEMEVDRLATAKTDSCIIVQRPGRRLADLLHDFTRR